ncbi:FIMAH domain-containing protein [Paenibacillus sp. MBLB4367]|uniref:FIMAH domain-containing protein n=1 Tax=Paenibacillus sp. MBLB4367 TaxID=3384767 RepID=UPI00390811DB
MKKKLLARCFTCLMATQLVAGSMLPLSSSAAAESAAAIEAAAGIPRMLITELVPDSGGDDALGEDPYEYLEVYNNSDQPIDFKDYSILYRYPGDPGNDLFWRPYTDEQIIIQPKQVMVFWAVTQSGEPKTVADFNQHFQTSLVENKDIVRIPGGLNNLRERTIVVATSTGTDIVSASYNPGVIDTAADLSIEYGVPDDGSLDMKKLSSKKVPASPGTFNSANVPAEPVRTVNDTVPPSVKDLTDLSGIDLIKPIELMAEAADDRLLASVNLYYKSNKTTNYKRVTLPRGADGRFRYSLEMMEWFGSPTLDYYFQASDTFNETSTAPRTLNLAGNEISPALNVRESDILSGERVLIGSSATEGSLSLSIDGQPVSPTEHALEKTAYFVFEADDIDKGQNVTTMGTETLHLIPFSTQDYKTMVVPVRPDLFKYGQANPIALRAGSVTRPYYENQPESGLDDFNIRNVRLVLADGTVIRDPKYANPATILDMGDNGRFLPVVYFNFTIPERYWDGISYRWNTASAVDGPHRVEVSLSDGSKDTASVIVDNQGPVVTTNITEGSTYKGAFDIQASASDAASSVKSFEVKLDGKLIEVPYSTSSAALTPGEHNLVLKAVDAGGKSTEKTIKFTTPAELPGKPLLAAPADGAQDTDTNVSLQVSVSDPTGDPLNVKFFKGQTITAADAGVIAYKHAADVEPPLTLTSPGETQLTAEEQTAAGASDDRYVTSDSTEQFPYQRFEVEVEAETGAGDRLELSWEGHSLKGRKVGLYAWNYSTEKWDSLTSTVAVSEEDFTLSAAVDGGNYARNGKVQVLIQDEIPRREQYDFTIASIPDTQIYAEIQPEYFESQVNFLRDAKESMNIQYVMQVGDIVNSAGIKGQWERADKFMKVVEDAQIPWGLVAGNHDVFDGGATSVPDYSEFSKYFGENRFKDKPYYGESYKDNKGHYDLISASGNDFIFVYMGWGMNDEDMGWMNNVLKQYPDRKAVIVVHEYLQNNATRSATGNQIYQKVVVPNPNVWMVMSGHFTGSALRTDQLDDNKDGQPDRKVYQILNDYQGIPNGGNGYLKLLHFDTETDTVYVNTYSPYLDDYNYYDPSKDEFKLSLDLKPMVKRVATDAMTVKVYANDAIGSAQAASGSTAMVNWNGLKGSTNYEWYALAEDSFGGRTYSDIWSFRTRLTVEAPQGVKAANVTEGSAQLSWSPVTASDGSSVTYQVYGSHGAVTTVTGTVYNLTGLEPDTAYTFQVKAVHSSGAVSVLSEPVSFRTLIDLPALQNGLQHFIAFGKVTPPLAKQLENVLSQAESHVQKGQLDQAAKKIEDFIKHLNNKALQELASADARQWLNDKAEALLRIWGR